MADTEEEGCPNCGSQSCVLISGPDDRSDEVENLDPALSGTYRCLRCGDEHYFEKEMKTPLSPLMKFSPTAKCPRCGTYRTITRYTDARKNQRGHECKGCNFRFLTQKADVR
jgi:DNA-directed RNA polymerase subunit RPC12/RpoP